MLTRKIKFASSVSFTAAMAIGFGIALPLSHKWIHFIFAHLKNVGIAGWWQPKWAFLSEILGIFDIFAQNPKMGTDLLIRSKEDILVNIILSGVITAAVLVYLRKARGVDKAFWLSAPLFVLLVFIKNYYIEQIHNYQYMKAYTIFLPVIFILIFAAIQFCSKSRARAITYLVTFVRNAMIALIMIHGLLYIYKYDSERGYVSADMLTLGDFGQKVDLNTYAVITHNLSMDEYMLAPIIALNWLNLNYAGNTPIIKPHADKKVVLLINKNDLKCSKCIANNYADYILYENPTFLLMDTKKRVRDSFDVKNKKYNIDFFTNLFPALN